jgi:hypothetical protein
VVEFAFQEGPTALAPLRGGRHGFARLDTATVNLEPVMTLDDDEFVAVASSLAFAK